MTFIWSFINTFQIYADLYQKAETRPPPRKKAKSSTSSTKSVSIRGSKGNQGLSFTFVLIEDTIRIDRKDLYTTPNPGEWVYIIWNLLYSHNPGCKFFGPQSISRSLSLRPSPRHKKSTSPFWRFSVLTLKIHFSEISHFWLHWGSLVCFLGIRVMLCAQSHARVALFLTRLAGAIWSPKTGSKVVLAEVLRADGRRVCVLFERSKEDRWSALCMLEWGREFGSREGV